MDTTAGFKRGDYKRACDICGHPWKRSQLRPIGQGRLACPDDYQGLTAEQISRYNASVPPLTVRAHKNVRFATDTGVYQLDEALIFNAVCTFARTARTVGPTGALINAVNPESAGHAACYLAGIIDEGTRPVSWINRAKVALDSLCTYLAAQQYGDPTGPAINTPTTDALYGGIVTGTTFNVKDTALAGEAFLASFRFTGQQQYLQRADRCATYLRHQQRMDLSTVRFTSTAPLGTGRRYLGGWPVSTTTAKIGNLGFFVESAFCLRFLALIRAIRGGSATYGEVTPGADFASSTLGTLDQMIAEAKAFYYTGVIPAGGSVAVSGFSSTTAAGFFSSFLSSATSGDGLWHGFPGAQITGSHFALALYGAFTVDGLTDLISGIYGYLMSATSNPSFQTAAGASPKTVAAGLTGNYDPTIALASVLNVTPPQNGSSTYDFSTAGPLAALRVASGLDVRGLKEALARPRRQFADSQPHQGLYFALGPIGASGLSFQIPGTTNVDLIAAAKLGLAYRFAPNTNSNVRAPS